MSASKVNVREAILKAADWIEKNPNKFSFMTYETPGNCGSPGCALGWIGFFYKTKITGAIGIAEKVLQVPGCGYGPLEDGASPFYKRMYDLLNGESWISSPELCAKGLRLYADKYHPAKPLKEFPSGSEIVRAFLEKPMKENEHVS